MAAAWYTLLPHRGIMTITGEDRRTFLQGLVSNDVRRVVAVEDPGGGRGIHAAVLTPQGRFLHEVFVVACGEALWLEGEAARLDDLRTRLARFRLRSRVTLAVADGMAVAACFGAGAPAAAGLPEPAGEGGAARPFAGGVAFVDPRLAAAGVRVAAPAAGLAAVLAAAGVQAAEADAFERLRLGLGLPDGTRDLVVDRSLLLEHGFAELHGVDFDKGCYMGQEVTARTRYRGLVKKRLVPVAVDGPLPEPGSPVLFGGREVGEMRSGVPGLGLALLRVDAMDEARRSGDPFTAGASRLEPRQPQWMILPEKEST